jgi:hypothetical protein
MSSRVARVDNLYAVILTQFELDLVRTLVYRHIDGGSGGHLSRVLAPYSKETLGFRCAGSCLSLNEHRDKHLARYKRELKEIGESYDE